MTSSGNILRTGWLKLSVDNIMEKGGQETANQEARMKKELSIWVLKVTKNHNRSNTGD